MRICFFIPSMTGGGAERVICSLSAHMTAKGHDVDILTINSGKSQYKIAQGVTQNTLDCSTKDNNALLRLLSLPIIEFKRIRRFERHVKSTKPDVVLSFSLTTNLISSIARMKNGTRLILTERTDPRRFSKLTQWVSGILYRKSDAFVVQSKGIADYYSKKKIKNISCIPNPINDQIVTMPLFNGVREKSVCAVGRLIKEKNYPMMIEAFGVVCKKHPEYKLCIYGEGYLHDLLAEQINRLGLGENVKLLGFHDNIYEILSCATLFVMTSDFEGFPNVLIEAMALGLPAVSTDFPSGVAREYIENGKTGWVVEKGDTSALINAIESIICDFENISMNCKMRSRQIITQLNAGYITNIWLDLIKKLSGEL